MGLRIETVAHGEDAMWLRLGRFFCDRATLKDMGGPIFSAPGMTWFVAVDGDAVVGFISLREKDDVCWYDYAYVVPERRGKAVFEKLSKAREKHLKGTAKPRRATMPDRRWPHYEERGWTLLSRRGSWITIERAA